MVSNTHETEIVVSKEITPQSSPKNTYGLNKSDLTESCSSNKSALSKNENKVKSSMQLVEDNVESNGVVAENLSSTNETIVLDNNTEMFYNEEVICDICGDLGFEKLLAICNNCQVGAEHIYCMKVKVNKVPDIWLCYDCVEDEDVIRKGEENEETSSRKRKVEVFMDSFKMEEITTSQRVEFLNTRNYAETRGLDLSKDTNLDLNKDPNLDISQGPNLDLFLAHASYFQSSSNILTTKLREKEFLRQNSADEEEEQCTKRLRVDK